MVVAVEESSARMTIAPRPMTAIRSVLAAALLAAVALGIGWRSLDYAWHWDDLHLIRPYSAVEVAKSLVGTWDPDNIETKGFRPGTVVFNDIRARLFGESVRGHRVFLVLLFSIYLVSLGALVGRLGGPWWVGLLAGVLTLCSKNSFYHYVWIADGIHLVPALAFVAAAHLLLAYLDRGTGPVAALSAVLMLLALAAREDALALYPALVIIGAAYLRLFERPREAYVRLARYAGLLAVTFLLVWVWRLMTVPSAPNFRVNRLVVDGLLTHVHWAVCLSGQAGTAPHWFVGACAILCVTAMFLPRTQRLHSLMWLALAAITCLPGAVRIRANLLLFPISFYAIFVMLVVAGIARTSRTAAAVALMVLAIAAGVSVRASRLEQLSLHPMSSDHIFRDWQAVYSRIRFSSMPPDRERATKATLARFGIVDDTFDFKRWERDLRQQGRVGVIEDGGAFVPETYFLTP